MTSCATCNEPLKAGAKFCTACGATVFAPATEAPRAGSRWRRWGVILGALCAALAVVGLTALVVPGLLGEGSKDAAPADPQRVASCLDEAGAVFARFGDDSDVTTLAVDLTGETSNAPTLYLYLVESDEAAERVAERLREIEKSTDIDVDVRGRSLIAYVTDPAEEKRALVESCVD